MNNSKKKYNPVRSNDISNNGVVINLIDTLGGVSKVAKICGLKRVQVVYNWIYRDKIPANHVILLCKKTGMKILPEQLRPDYFYD